MTAQLSREELKQSLIECNQNASGMFEVGEDAMCAMMALLAGMDSEPVGEVVDIGGALMVEWNSDVKEGDVLYAAPPAPDSFVVEKAMWDALNRVSCAPVFMRIATEACRAAMQAEPVTAATWIDEAKKLAEMHGTSFVVFRNGEEPQCADPSKVVISFTDKGFGYPVAPEQEV